MTKSERVLHQKRKLRNFLINVGLQLRYTAVIIGVAVFLTAFLGYRIYVATQETTRIVTMTAAVDPSVERELRSQFQANDRVVLWGIVGFGVLLIGCGHRCRHLDDPQDCRAIAQHQLGLRQSARQQASRGPGEVAQGRRTAGLSCRVPRDVPGLAFPGPERQRTFWIGPSLPSKDKLPAHRSLNNP
jgi:hypothetical protein